MRGMKIMDAILQMYAKHHNVGLEIKLPHRQWEFRIIKLLVLNRITLKQCVDQVLPPSMPQSKPKDH
jgi:hypothetical protein